MARALCMAVAFMLGTAVVQANQCSSGSERPRDFEPHNLVSLRQTKLRMNMLKDGSSKMELMKNPSAMLTELEGMIRSGETPAFDLITTIKALILDEIMPSLKTTRDAAADATTDALTQIQLCNNESKTAEINIAKGKQTDVETARSHHATCREAEKSLYDHNLTNCDSYCVKLGKFLHGAEPLKIVAGSPRHSSIQYVTWASSTNMCSLTKLTELDNGCTASEAELADKKTECSVDQQAFETEFCLWKAALEANCKELDTCYSTTVMAYDNHVSKTRTLVEKWNVETAALQKILCYCNVWLSEKDGGDNRSKHNATQFDVCKDQTHVPSSVDYGTPEAKIPCLLTSVANHPGTSGFITSEYENFTDFVKSVVPCTVATTAAPTIQATTTAPTGALWPQLGVDKSKCEKTSRPNVVPSRAACQSKAVANGHTYYQYQSEGKLCDTVSTCESPITGTNNPWKIYHQAPTGALWPQLGADKSKCEKTSRPNVVPSRAACQSWAISNGHTYYQYQSEGKLCDTVSSCESPITGTNNPWKIYHQAPTTPTTEAPCTTEAPTTGALWPQLGADKSKCEKTSPPNVVTSRAACQSEAISNGHTYYQYQSEGKLCDTVSSCESPITGTKNPWKIYYQAPTSNN